MDFLESGVKLRVRIGRADYRGGLGFAARIAKPQATSIECRRINVWVRGEHFVW